MAIFNLLSKRARDAERAGQAEVYYYDVVPISLRVQICNIAVDALGEDRWYQSGRGSYEENPSWIWIEDTYLHEKGLATQGLAQTAGARVRHYYTNADHSAALDLTELIAHRVDKATNGRGLSKQVEELNYRLREACVGYQVENGLLIRTDSQFVHAEVVKPALNLIGKPGFAGVQEEFLDAHQHYRAGEYRQAVSMAANAMESAFRAVFDAKGWGYTDKRISGLVRVAKANKLWPDYLDNSFDQLTASLQSGLPQIRNEDASHGQGGTPREVPGYVAAYALHQAASAIVFIVSAAAV